MKSAKNFQAKKPFLSTMKKFIWWGDTVCKLKAWRLNGRERTISSKPARIDSKLRQENQTQHKQILKCQAAS